MVRLGIDWYIGLALLLAATSIRCIRCLLRFKSAFQNKTGWIKETVERMEKTPIAPFHVKPNDLGLNEGACAQTLRSSQGNLVWNGDMVWNISIILFAFFKYMNWYVIGRVPLTLKNKNVAINCVTKVKSEQLTEEVDSLLQSSITFFYLGKWQGITCCSSFIVAQ